MNPQQQYEFRRRQSGNITVSIRLTSQQALAIKTAGGPTRILRAVADALLAHLTTEINS